MLDPRPRRLPLLAASALLLAGCGVTFPWTTTPTIHATVEFTPTSLSFAGHLGGATPALQTVDVRVQPGWLTWGLGPDSAAGAFLGVVNQTDLGDGWRRYEVLVGAPDQVGAGPHGGTLQIFGCAPPDCAPVAGLGASIPVTYAVGPLPIAVDTTPLHFEQVVGGPLAAHQVLSLTGPDDGQPWSTSLDFQGAEPWLEVTPASGTALPADLAVQVTSPASGTPRTLWALLRVSRGDVTATVSVTLAERWPGFTSTTTSLSFVAVQDQPTLPAPQQVVLETTTGAAAPYWAVKSASWLAQPADGTAPGAPAVSPNTTHLAPGGYDDVLTFRPAGGLDPAGTVFVGIHYDVLPRGVEVAPSSFWLRIDKTTTPAGLSSQVDVTTPTSPDVAWTAEPLDPWLAVTPASGTGPATLTVSVPLDKVASLPEGTTPGRISVRYVDPMAGPLTREVTVYTSLGLPRVFSAQPHLVVAGSTAALSLYIYDGSGSPVVLFDGSPATSMAPQAGFTALVIPPALTAGHHELTIQNALGLAWRPLGIDAVAPAARTGAWVASSGRKGSIAFDDLARVLYVANPEAGRIEWYAEADGWARSERAVSSLADAALSPDGTQLALLTPDGASVLDAAAPQGTLTPLFGIFGAEAQGLPWRLTFAADGQAVVTAPPPGACQGIAACGVRYVGLSVGQLWMDYNTTTTADGWSMAAPDDGSSVWLVRKASGAPEPLGRYFPFGAGLTFSTPVTFSGTALDLDRHGTRALLLDVDPAFVGTVGRLADLATGLLPGALPLTTAAALLSQDGLRAVTFDGQARTVRTFDLAAPPDPGTGLFVEPTPGFAPPADPGAAPVLALSMDERTLFLAGDDAVVICPLP